MPVHSFLRAVVDLERGTPEERGGPREEPEATHTCIVGQPSQTTEPMQLSPGPALPLLFPAAPQGGSLGKVAQVLAAASCTFVVCHPDTLLWLHMTNTPRAVHCLHWLDFTSGNSPLPLGVQPPRTQKCSVNTCSLPLGTGVARI